MSDAAGSDHGAPGRKAGRVPTPPLRLTLPRELAAVATARRAVMAYLPAAGISERTAHRAGVCLEELLVNVVEHGLRGAVDHEIVVLAEIAADAVRISLQDDAPPFDPTAVAPAPRPASLVDAPTGGRGLVVVREFASGLRYERRGDLNVLELVIAR